MRISSGMFYVKDERRAGKKDCEKSCEKDCEKDCTYTYHTPAFFTVFFTAFFTVFFRVLLAWNNVWELIYNFDEESPVKLIKFTVQGKPLPLRWHQSSHGYTLTSYNPSAISALFIFNILWLLIFLFSFFYSCHVLLSIFFQVSEQ